MVDVQHRSRFAVSATYAAREAVALKDFDSNTWADGAAFGPGLSGYFAARRCNCFVN